MAGTGVFSPLLVLPQELLVRVSSFLNTVELGILRLTCKEIELRLFADFAMSFFSKKQFMIEHVSLEALVAIANHPGLAPYLTDVLIGTHTLEFPADDIEKLNYHGLGYVDHKTLMNTGMAKEMLTEAFSKLPNLQTIGLRDYNGAGRFVDGPNALWKSWGWSYMKSAYGHAYESPSAVLPLLLSATAAANKTPGKLEVFLHKSFKLLPEAFFMPGRQPDRSKDALLSNLKSVMLALEFNADSEYGHPRSEFSDQMLRFGLIANFIRQIENVEKLRLNFKHNDRAAVRFLDWLGTTSKSPDTSEMIKPGPYGSYPSASLSFLRELDLGKVAFEAPMLPRIIKKFSLTSLNLWEVCLTEESGGAEIDLWARTLNELSDDPPEPFNIGNVMIGRPRQATGGHRYGSSHVTQFAPFGTKAEDKEKALRSEKVEFHGKNSGISVSQWLREVALCTYVVRPIVSHAHFSHSSMDEDMDESDEIDFDEDDNDDEDDIDEDDAQAIGNVIQFP